MGRSAKKKTRKRAAPASKVLESITGSDALSILKLLAERDDKLVEVIDATARELLGQVDTEDVATDVQMELELLDVEEVWERSGATRDGYVDPGDAAWQMFEDALKPFEDSLEKYKRLSMSTQARSCCEGLLKGIYDFHRDSSTEYKDWAVDAPSEFFGQILDEWKSLFKGRPPLLEMEKFLLAHCPNWTEWGMRLLRERKR
jgi:hypothetical protein